MYLLPKLWPPHCPTHRLVYIPPPTAGPSNPYPTPLNLTPTNPTFPSDASPLPTFTRRNDPDPDPPSPIYVYAGTYRPVLPPIPIPLSPDTSDEPTPSPVLPLHHLSSSSSSSTSSPILSHGLTESDLNHLDVYLRPRLLPDYRPRDAIPEHMGRRYEMSMRQQPVQARMCGAGEKSDRRPIDPPPIVQLKVFDTDGEDMWIEKGRKGKKSKKGPGGMSFMHNPYYFLYATLIGSDDAQTELHVIDDGKTRFLTGTPVSSLYYLKDLNSRDAAFFVFPDLGVRKEGKYKLKLTLFEIVDQEVFYCATSYTDTFTVLSAKKFPGMQRATDLSRTFAEQGLKIRVRKEGKKRSSATPTRNKRRSSITEQDDSYFASLSKRSRPSLDPSYSGITSPYPPGYYPHAAMPPPPVPHTSSRHSQSIGHPPPAPYYGSQSGRPSTFPPPAEHHRPRNPSEGYDLYPPPLSAVKQESPTRHGYRHEPRRYEQTEQDRRRQWEMQLEQRREIDGRREAEARRIAEVKERERGESPKKRDDRKGYPPPQYPNHQYGHYPPHPGYPHHRAETYPPGTYGHPPAPHCPGDMRYDTRARDGSSTRERSRDSRPLHAMPQYPRPDHTQHYFAPQSPYHAPPPLRSNLSSTSQHPRHSLPTPSRSNSSFNRNALDHYEPSNRLVPQIPNHTSTPRKDSDKEIKRLPSISSFTPGQSRSGTPGTPATSASNTTGGRDHRMGLGHLVD